MTRPCVINWHFPLNCLTCLFRYFCGGGPALEWTSWPVASAWSARGLSNDETQKEHGERGTHRERTCSSTRQSSTLVASFSLDLLVLTSRRQWRWLPFKFFGGLWFLPPKRSPLIFLGKGSGSQSGNEIKWPSIQWVSAVGSIFNSSPWDWLSREQVTSA